MRILTLLLAFTSLPLQAEMDISQDLSDLTPEERAWMEDDSELNAIAISSGEIRWIEPEKTKNSYRLETDLFIPKSALDDGWINFQQCHFELDAVPKIEVVYHPDKTRSLALSSSKKIEHITVNQASVTLEKVSKGAFVCISGQSKALIKTAKGYTLNRGPYMRKFLSGYYPMHLKEQINWNKVPLTLISPESTNQLGKSIIATSKHISANYWFEGKLQTHYNFSYQKDTAEKP